MLRMFKNQRYNLRQVFLVVVAFYLFFFVIGMIASYVAPNNPSAELGFPKFSVRWVLSQVTSIVFSTLFYYYTVNAFHRLMVDRKKILSYLEPAFIGFVACALYFLANFYFFSEKEIRVSVRAAGSEQLTVGLMIFSLTLSAMFFIGLSLLISYLTFLRDEKKQRKILEEQKMQLEVEKSQANLNFLKAQINPHFLHNTLNFLYAKSLPYSSELSEGILTLSDIMRYALSEGNAKDGKAPLKDEIEHVRNVIKINQLRFSNNLKVNFDVTGVVNGAMIIPFVLITIVENAFKHGDLKSPEHPIDIRLSIQGKHLHFFCRNRKKAGPKELSTGIGLHNIQKQLELAYGKGFSLNVKDEAEFYTTELTIDPV